MYQQRQSQPQEELAPYDKPHIESRGLKGAEKERIPKGPQKVVQPHKPSCPITSKTQVKGIQEGVNNHRDYK